MMISPTKRQFWTQQEDSLLIQLYSQHGPNWSKLHELFNEQGYTRSGKQIRDRYINSLQPGILHGKWTEQEDSEILKQVQNLGNRWSEIAKLLSGRTENMVKNRYYAVLRKKEKEVENLEQMCGMEIEKQEETKVLPLASADQNQQKPQIQFTKQKSDSSQSQASNKQNFNENMILQEELLMGNNSPIKRNQNASNKSSMLLEFQPSLKNSLNSMLEENLRNIDLNASNNLRNSAITSQQQLSHSQLFSKFLENENQQINQKNYYEEIKQIQEDSEILTGNQQNFELFLNNL